MASPKKNDKPVTICALINSENELIGYFATPQKALDKVEQEGLEEATVLEVFAAFDIVAPPEPEYELIEKKLKEMLRS